MRATALNEDANFVGPRPRTPAAFLRGMSARKGIVIYEDHLTRAYKLVFIVTLLGNMSPRGVVICKVYDREMVDVQCGYNGRKREYNWTGISHLDHHGGWDSGDAVARGGGYSNSSGASWGQNIYSVSEWGIRFLMRMLSMQVHMYTL